MDESSTLPADTAADFLGTIIPGSGPLVRKSLRKLEREWARNTSGALRAAERISGLSREELQDRAENDPRLIPLYLKVIWAAGMNGHDATLRAMGATLGRAVEAAEGGDEATIEDAELALRAMGDLTARHFTVLGRLAASENEVPVKDTNNYSGTMPEAVAGETGISPDTTYQLLLNLAAAGLVKSVPVYGGTAYPITALGFAVVEAAVAVQ